MNIVLTGLRGSGKTKLGKLIAEKLNKNFIDIDEEIEKHQKKIIPEIIEKNGWEYFRKIEKRIIKKISKEKNTIISTGGGSILDEENIKNLKKNGKLIYLKQSPKICAERINKSTTRPTITDKKTIEEEMEQLFKERDVTYTKTADIIIEKTNNPEEDTNKIIEITALF